MTKEQRHSIKQNLIQIKALVDSPHWTADRKTRINVLCWDALEEIQKSERLVSDPMDLSCVFKAQRELREQEAQVADTELVEQGTETERQTVTTLTRKE